MAVAAAVCVREELCSLLPDSEGESDGVGETERPLVGLREALSEAVSEDEATSEMLRPVVGLIDASGATHAARSRKAAARSSDGGSGGGAR